MKESGWNERFHLNHIPEYNYQNEPHSQCKAQQIQILKTSSEFQIEEILQGQKDFMSHHYKKVTKSFT